MSYSIYNLTSGVFTGLQFVAEWGFVADNLPAGCGAWPGLHDAARVRVDMATQALVPYQPPAPANSDLAEWVWDPQAWRWQAVPTALAIAEAVRADRDRRLLACDWVVARAVEQSQAVPAAWAAYRQSLRDVPAQPGFPSSVEWPAEPLV